MHFCTALEDRLMSACVSYATDAAGAAGDGRCKEEENPMRISTNKAQSKPFTVESLSEWKIPANSNRQASPEV